MNLINIPCFLFIFLLHNLEVKMMKFDDFYSKMRVFETSADFYY